MKIVCVNNCFYLFSKLYSEVFTNKYSKLHFDVSNQKICYVDGASSKWIDISRSDAIVAKVTNQIPTGFNYSRRSFDHHKALEYSIQNSIVTKCNSYDKKIKLNNSDIYLINFPNEYKSARSFLDSILPNYSSNKLSKVDSKKLKLYIAQLSALLPTFDFNKYEFSEHELLNALIEEIDNKNIFYESICKSIKLYVESDKSDFLRRHNKIINTLLINKNMKVSSNINSDEEKKSINELIEYQSINVDSYDKNIAADVNDKSSLINYEDLCTDTIDFSGDNFEFQLIKFPFNNISKYELSTAADYYDWDTNIYSAKRKYNKLI